GKSGVKVRCGVVKVRCEVPKVRYEVAKVRCEVVKVGQKWGEETAFGVIGMGCKKKSDLF
ncbi:MAG: hypothetical protein II199_07285, partial [Bacteroidaceae bacterium]|nr:hypothetical protein [Bacteroidaceae bacterium]